MSTWYAAAALAALTLVVHWPALGGGTVWDDSYLVFANRFIHSPDGLAYYWFGMQASDYFPLTSTLHWLEWRLWGEDPFGYHAVNVALHTAAALALWRVLARLAVPAPLVAASLFAVHPVTVASVAWISELKNVLALWLAALALVAWLRFEDAPRRRRYVTALALYLAALLAKTAVVMLPVLLLLLAWHRRQRITATDVARTLPFFAFSLVLGLATVYHQHRHAIGAFDVRPEGMLSRLAAAGWAVWFYLGKALVPLDLAMIYPRWEVDATSPLAWVPLAALGALALPAWRARHGWGRAVLVALGAFVALLAPVLGLVAMSFHQHALVSDHLQYVALIAPLALVVAAVATGLRRLGGGWPAGAVVTALALLTLAVLTQRRIPVFASDEALWRDTLAKNPRAWAAHNNLGDVLFHQGAHAQAAAHHREALRLKPDAAEAHNNLGRALAELGEHAEAARHYALAIRHAPGLAAPHNNLALALARHGERARAEEHYRTALGLDPDYADAHNNYGTLLAADGRDADAEAHYRRALALDPTHVGAHSNLGNLLVRRGRLAEAIEHFRRAITLAPERAALHANLGIAAATQGRHEAALGHYAEALRLEPHLAQAHHNRGNSLLALGRRAEAAAAYRAALAIDPTLAAARQNLAIVLGTGAGGE